MVPGPSLRGELTSRQSPPHWSEANTACPPAPTSIQSRLTPATVCLQVRVLEHIGDACIKKLRALPEHVAEHPEVALPAAIPEGKVLTVAHMHALVTAVENDKTAESKLFLKTLKLNDVRPTSTPPHARASLIVAPLFYCVFAGAVAPGCNCTSAHL